MSPRHAVEYLECHCCFLVEPVEGKPPVVKRLKSIPVKEDGELRPGLCPSCINEVIKEVVEESEVNDRREKEREVEEKRRRKTGM